MMDWRSSSRSSSSSTSSSSSSGQDSVNSFTGFESYYRSDNKKSSKSGKGESKSSSSKQSSSKSDSKPSAKGSQGGEASAGGDIPTDAALAKRQAIQSDQPNTEADAKSATKSSQAAADADKATVPGAISVASTGFDITAAEKSDKGEVRTASASSGEDKKVVESYESIRILLDRITLRALIVKGIEREDSSKSFNDNRLTIESVGVDQSDAFDLLDILLSCWLGPTDAPKFKVSVVQSERESHRPHHTQREGDDTIHEEGERSTTSTEQFSISKASLEDDEPLDASTSMKQSSKSSDSKSAASAKAAGPGAVSDSKPSASSQGGEASIASDEEGERSKLVFQEGMTEKDTRSCLRANLRMVSTPEFTSNMTTYLGLNALRSMKLYPESIEIHENGCKLLACLIDIASDASVDQGGIASDELAIMHDLTISLAHHKNNPEAVASGLSAALQNFCVLLSTLDLEGYTISSLATADDLAGCLAVEISTLVFYREDEDILERVTGALWALCTLKEGLALSPDITDSIGLIVGAMNRFPDSEDLHLHSIGLLGEFFSVSNDIMDFVNAELVTALIRFIEQYADNVDAADMIDTAVNIILIISKKGCTAVTILLGNERLIQAVVGSMYKFPDSVSVQGASIDILTNIALDNFLRADVSQRGGTSMIIFALVHLKHDPIVTCKAFAALANLLSGASVEILRAAPQIFVRAMVEHTQNVSIQVDEAYAMWALSARDESFKEDLVNLGGVAAVAEAMARFPASRQMQARGFVGQVGIEPVVNGLSAHIMSEKACEEALGCLRCLSTIPVNKDLLEEQGAVDLIYACIWMHPENPTVCKAALAALCNISVNVDRNQVSEITSEDLDSVVHAMRAHQNVKVVQESAIILLRNFTFCPSNVSVLEQSPFLVNLVRSAMANHNDHFQGRTEDLLWALPVPVQ